MEEAKRRRDHLAKMRSLLFHQETKLKHLAKIKSKDYHRRAQKAARAKVCFSRLDTPLWDVLTISTGTSSLDQDSLRGSPAQNDTSRVGTGMEREGAAGQSRCARRNTLNSRSWQTQPCEMLVWRHSACCASHDLAS